MSSDKNKTIDEGMIDTFRSGRPLDTLTIVHTHWRFVCFIYFRYTFLRESFARKIIKSIQYNYMCKVYDASYNVPEMFNLNDDLRDDSVRSRSRPSNHSPRG